ncbi:GDP-D-glucose phosphorylase 1 isoform X1 [Mirounga leonina]|uniref:GDP-D-glucose phosphorylase 1 isoform X1 n=2 Tax=Mirounga leonina TaxID=9715 RepID=UPI00156C104D|nr:GDP-D-glucose phosphorylase 1 isoform X1 [Mirounga leonina]
MHERTSTIPEVEDPKLREEVEVSAMAAPQDSNETSYLLPPNSKDWEEQGIPDFVYGQKELVLEGIQWPRTAPGLLDTPRSRFDSALCSAWRQRMDLGLFRYRLGELQTQTLPGAVGLVAQLNVERGVQRRRPQNIRSVKQAFDPEQFNFNKVRPGEVLFRLLREPDLPGALRQEDILVMINVSPLEWGHVLLVPEPTRGLPQRLLPSALRAGVEAVLLSSHPGFRVGFNSLGGSASVNHLHLHGYYLARRLPVEGAPSEPLDPGGRLHLLRALPAPGFLFYTGGPGPDLEALIGRVCRATDYLTDHEIAHNLFVTRGTPPGKTSPSSALTGVRVILWARKSSFGVKEGEAFNVALCELAGHLPVKTSRDFGSLTEAAALALIQDCLLPSAQAEEVQAALVAVIAQDEQ